MPRFIVFEGNDASGKDTQINLLTDYLKKRKTPFELIEYPGHDTLIGGFIRNFLNKEFDLIPDVQAMLYAAEMINDREKIRIWLKQGKYVIANRYFSSTLAYQSIKGKSSDKLIKFVEIFNMPKPDIIIFLKISPNTCVERKGMQKKNPDRFESDIDFLKKVDESYDYLIKNNMFSQWFVLDGEKTREEIFDQVKKILRME